MGPTTIERATSGEPRLIVPEEMRPVVLEIYRERLTRLLAWDGAEAAPLDAAESRRLHSRAVLATVRALTEMDEGATASALLRAAHRP